MERMPRAVKRPRTYDSSRRAAQAARTRAAALEIAERLFVAHGYATTTIGEIAAEAGVSVETIYKAFGGKPGLVRAIRDWRLGGAQRVHAETRSDRMRIRERDPRAIVANWGTLTAEVAPLVAPILLLVRAAAQADHDVAALHAELEADRLKRMRVNARYLHSNGHLRTGISLKEATDVLWTFSSPELYELLVVHRGWRLERFGRFVGEGIAAALLDR